MTAERNGRMTGPRFCSLPSAVIDRRYRRILKAPRCQALTDTAIETGKKIGPVTVEMGNTSCHVPFAPDSIRKVQKRGAIGKKRKSARC
jgi:hypothetical protein